MSQLGGREQPPAAPVAAVDRQQAQAQAMLFYLELLHRMVLAGPAEQAEIFANVKRAYDEAPSSPTAQLRLALALAAPGHPSSDGAGAQRLLRQVLSAPEELAEIEHAVAYLELQKLDRQLLLASENARLQEANGRSERDRVATLTRRLSAESEENARLKKALDEARAKLDAIAAIERQSSERTPSPGRNP